MSAITATVDIEDDVTGIVTNLLRQFPRGTRVKLAISEVPAAAPVPGLEEYRQRVAAARAQAVSDSARDLATDVVRGIDALIHIQRVPSAHAFDVEQVADVVHTLREVRERNIGQVETVVTNVEDVIAGPAARMVASEVAVEEVVA